MWGAAARAFARPLNPSATGGSSLDRWRPVRGQFLVKADVVSARLFSWQERHPWA